MTVNPNGTISLCRTKLENDYKNQLTFSNLQSQYNYFASTVVQTFTDYTYIRKDNSINVAINIDSIINCNYLFYVNNGFTTKRYYCFITNMEYINENCTKITFETDCYQTWLFDIQYNACFIEREHVNNDTIGLHTVPESLETGTYINCSSSVTSDLGTNSYICIGVSEPIDDTSEIYHEIYNGVMSGIVYYVLQNITSADFFIRNYTKKGKIDAIQMIFMIPNQFLPNPRWQEIPGGGGNYAPIENTNLAYNLTGISIDVPTKIGKNYKPKNNKLLTYPFRYLLGSNNCGSDVIYHYEDFDNISTLKIGFNVVGSISPGCNIKIVPTYYKNIATDSENRNFEESFNAAKFPIGSWINDIYTNWLRQNGLNIGISVATNVAQLFNPSTTLNGLTGIAQNLSQIYQHEMIPNQAEGNTNSSDIMFALKKIAPIFYHMSIKDEYAEIIDNYFSMFGYKVNTVKIPNIYGRRNWNYVKTVDCNFDGNIPQQDLSIIKQMFNNGVTLWHSASSMYNYNNDNSII